MSACCSSREVWSPRVFSDNSIGYREGLHLWIVQVFDNRRKEEAVIIDDPLATEENTYSALFNREDVDFEIRVENRLSSDVKFTITIGNSRFVYVLETGVKASLKALQSDGKHLHFVSQKTSSGRLLVAMSATANGTTYEQAAVDCSRIKFDFTLAKTANEKKREESENRPRAITDARRLYSNEGTKKMEVFIGSLTGRFSLELYPQDVVELVKLIIQEKKGTPLDEQRLIFDGMQMEDSRTLQYYGVKERSTLHLVRRLRGGGYVEKREVDRVKLLLGDPQPKARGPGKRGVVCFGKQTNQQFKVWDQPFIASTVYSLEGFTLELRTKPACSICP